MIENLIFTSTDNNVKSLYENYRFEYELFLIESSVFNTFAKIDMQMIQESGDLEMIQESIKETLTVWVGRFTEGLQRSLNKFTQVIDGMRDLTYLRSIETKVNELNQDPGFTVTNIRNYNDERFNGLSIAKFNETFNTNKESLQNQEQFLIQNYSSIGFKQGNTDIKQVLESYLVQTVTDPVNVNVELIRGYYKWCRNDYKNALNKIQSNMNVYNESTKAISSIINGLPDDYKNTQQTEGNPLVTPANNDQTSHGESYNFLLSEAPVNTTPNNGAPNNVTPNPVNSAQINNNKTPNSTAKMTFDNKADYVAQSAGVSNQETVNAIKTYLSTTTRILATLFIIIKNRKADYMRVLKHLFPMNREQQQIAQSTVNINQTQTQVDTSNLIK